MIYKFIHLLFSLGILFSWARANTVQKLEVHFEESVEINKDNVLFKDVAMLRGYKADSLKNIVVGKSAGYGRSRYLSTWPIYVRHIKDLESKADIVFKGPERVKITTSFIPVKRDSLHELLDEYFENYNKKSRSHFEYDLVSAPSKIKIPEEKTVIKLIRKAKGELRGNQKFSMQIYNGEKLLRSYPFKVYVRQFDSVFVAREKVERSTKLAKSSVNKEWKDVTRVSGEIIRDLSVLKGSMVRQPIVSGRVITHNLFTAIPVVEQGDPVQIESNSGGIQITLNGIAREDGALGDVIRVKNLLSRKIIRAKIVEPGKLVLVSNSLGG